MANVIEKRPAEPVDNGWLRSRGEPSLLDVFRTIKVAPGGTPWRKFLAFFGPGYLVAVGYMDPGNWATSLAGGAQFGYALLFIALLSNIMAIILQSLCARLAIGTGRDLAQACRDAYPRWVAWPLWLLAELAICATDLAEVTRLARRTSQNLVARMNCSRRCLGYQWRQLFSPLRSSLVV